MKKVHRHGGGTSMNTFPARVFKGKRMAGRFGNEKVTARNLKVVRVDAENNLLLVRGAVPGANGGYVVVRAIERRPLITEQLISKCRITSWPA